jgi:hypothetical protein
LLQLNLWGQVFDVVVLMNNGANDKRINFVYMGDGYTGTQQTDFVNNTQSTIDAQFNFTPYKEYKNFFNAYAIKVISNEEGVDHPNTSPDSDCDPVPVMVADTYFDSTFDYYNIHRLLVPQDYTAIYNVLSENTPFYDQANIIVNTPYYGGSGGAFATASTNTSSNLIMIHEIGHSFADLADEYWAGIDYATEKANMTQETDPTLVKWKNWISDENIGIYAHGSSPPESDWYRPHQSCMMRQLNGQFCAVCRETTIDHIYTLVTPIDSYLPTENTVDFVGDDLNFLINLILPEPNTLEIEWFIDGVSFATGVDNITLTNTEITDETHIISVNVEDTTTLSRTYTFANGYLFSLSWNIDNTLGFEENQIQKFLYKIYPNPTQSHLTFSYTAEYIQEPFTLLISNLQGKKIQTKIFTPNNGSHELSIDVNNLEAGIYIINLKASHYNRSFKFIKE